MELCIGQTVNINHNSQDWLITNELIEKGITYFVLKCKRTGKFTAISKDGSLYCPPVFKRADLTAPYKQHLTGKNIKLTIKEYNMQKETPQTKETKTMKNNTQTLYTFKLKNKTVYGTFVQEDSDGNFVMQVSKTEDYVAVNPKDVQEVAPYTIVVEKLGDAAVYSMKAKKGSVKKGDLLSLDVEDIDGLFVVKDIDTKDKTTDLVLKGRIVPTKAIK